MLDYLPLIIILGGLGVMAYFFTRSGKKAEKDRSTPLVNRWWDKYPRKEKTLILAGSPEG